MPENGEAKETKQMGIEETKDVLQALEAVGVKSAVLKDGFQLKDITTLTGIVSPVVDAIKGVGDVDDELKDLSQAELAALGSTTISVVQNIVKAWKNA